MIFRLRWTVYLIFFSEDVSAPQRLCAMHVFAFVLWIRIFCANFLFAGPPGLGYGGRYPFALKQLFLGRNVQVSGEIEIAIGIEIGSGNGMWKSIPIPILNLYFQETHKSR